MRSELFRKVLITGISGSGGSYLAERILNKYPNCEIYGIFRSHTSGHVDNLEEIIQQIKIFSCDMQDFGQLFRILDEISPDLIFNVASQANVLDSFLNSQSTLFNNVVLMSNLLEVLRILKSDAVLVHCSTSEVYGIVNEKEIPITENQHLRPSSPYSVSKITQDLLCDVYGKVYGLKIIKTRMFTYINPRRTDLFAPSFAKQIAEIEIGKRQVLRHGNLNSIRTILDIRDAMDAYIHAANFCKFGETYNIGGDFKLTIKEFLEKMLAYSEFDIKTEIDEKLMRPIDVTLQIPDDSKFRTMSGWQPIYSLDESILHLLDFWRRRISR